MAFQSSRLRAAASFFNRSISWLAAVTVLVSTANAQLDYYSVIEASQVPTFSNAGGSAVIDIDPATNQLDYTIVFSGLLTPETMAHFHAPANPGEVGPIVHELPLGSPKIGSWVYPEELEADILGGRMFIAIHSVTFPDGEIRGQVCPIPDWYCGGDQALCPCGNGTNQGGCANSTGVGSNMSISGLPSVILDTLVVRAENLPPNQFGLFYNGNATAQDPFGNGLRCVGGTSVNRFPVQSSGPAGRIEIGPGLVDFSQTDFPPAGAITAGQTWYFQGWYRDPGGPCGASFNFTDAIAVSFTP